MSNRQTSPEEQASLQALGKRLIAMQEVFTVLALFYMIFLLRMPLFEHYIIENLMMI